MAALAGRQTMLAGMLKKLVPICFVSGAAMEFFMIKTGFYDIVKKAEAQKRLEAKQRTDYEAKSTQLSGTR